MASAPPEPPSPITVQMMGVLQVGHFQQVAGDGFALAALLGTDAGVGARGVDQGQQGQAEALGHLHQAQGLAVALGARHAEVAAYLALGVARLLVADDHHRAAIDAAQATDDGGVVRVGAVAGQLVEFLADHADVVQRVRARRMARQLGDLPRREVAEDLVGLELQLLAQAADFLIDIERLPMAGMAKLFNLRVQLGDGLFEIEEVGVHSVLFVTRKRRSIPVRGISRERGRMGGS